jgi:putative ABC transport system ATP-binding protein
MVEPAIRVTDAVKQYRTRNIETTALNRVSFEVAKGEFVAIMGPSGCGKSTLLNLLGMLDRLDGGSYALFGRETKKISERERAALRRDHLGFVFQSFNLIEQLSVKDNIQLALHYAGVHGAKATAKLDGVLSRLELSARRDHLPAQLSGGQQQRVAIARAVVNSPGLILADEPTGNLDPTNRAEVLSILKTLNKEGTTIVMVTHSEEDANEAHRRINLRDGVIVQAR